MNLICRFVAAIFAFIAVAHVCNAQSDRVSFDMGGSIAANAAKNFGDNSPEALLANAYAPNIGAAYLKVNSAGALDPVNGNGFAENAVISVASANAIAVALGLNAGWISTTGTDTVTSTTTTGVKARIEYTTVANADGTIQVNYKITVTINGVTSSKDSSVKAIVTIAYLKSLFAQANNNTSTGGGGSGGSGPSSPPPSSPTSSAAPTDSQLQNYSGPGGGMYFPSAPSYGSFGPCVSLGFE